MPRAYSHCFFNVTGIAAAYDYQVPADYKALVLAVTAFNGANEIARAYLGVGGIYVYTTPNLGPYDGFSAPVRLVIGAGGVLRLATEGSNCCTHVAGFLLRDDGEADAFAAVAVTSPPTLPVPEDFDR